MKTPTGQELERFFKKLKNDYRRHASRRQMTRLFAKLMKLIDKHNPKVLRANTQTSSDPTKTNLENGGAE